MKPLQLFYFLGIPFSPLYGMAMKIRSLLYSKNVLKTSRLSIPVISVGNLTMGGSGKTPTVQMLSRFLQKSGFTVGVISRGYGGKANKDINVVSDGTNILLPAEEAGDEPFMLAQSVPGLRVVTGKKRSIPAQYAQDHLKCDVLILDDGFQHMAVHRDLDIVLFNATTLAGNNRVFPAGDLREPKSALQRADIFLLTGVTDANRENSLAFKHKLTAEFPNTPVFTTQNSVDGVYDQNNNVLNVSDYASVSPLYALSGIANPERFIQLLTNSDICLSGHTALKDHTEYNSELIAKISQKALSSGAQGIITTHKDLVKMENLAPGLPLYCLKISAQPSGGFYDYIATRLSLPLSKG
ncbi:tetraacyldisaccharide 4'-kinase [Desulfosediminicola ganghwensis]|uniref:tetraacyldisaccharide 4'-kinase n=1 Tax=Desulfosediminicola ganghwensis TaxID=2569540 RepID=UPI0010ACB52C|nr:tetraacyldisaccharide 4'-kinase [Desulfosediminicola ganghwensis]